MKSEENNLILLEKPYHVASSTVHLHISTSSSTVTFLVRRFCCNCQVAKDADAQ